MMVSPRRPTVVGEYAVVITIATIAIVATVPLWFPWWFALAWLLWIEGAQVGVWRMIVAPLVLAAVLSALNLSAFAGSRAERVAARTAVDRDAWRWRTYWSGAGSALAVGFLVAYVGFSVWSMVP